MPVAFPILSLPPNGFQTIAKFMSYQDLFWISTCSTKSFNLVRNTVLLFPGVQKFKMNVHLASSSSVAFHGYFFGNWEYTEWNLYGKRDPRRFGIENNSTSSTNRNLAFWRESQGCNGCVSASDSIEDVLQFIQHVAYLFDGTIGNLSISPERTSHLEFIQSIDLLRKSDSVTITDGTLDHDAMRRVLVGFEATKLKIWCSVDDGFNFEDIRLPETTNVSILALSANPIRLAYKCENLTLKICEMSYEDIFGFLRHWRDSYSRMPQRIQLVRDLTNRESLGIYDTHWARNWRQEKENMVQISRILEDIIHPDREDFGYSRRTFKRRTDGMMLHIRRRWRRYHFEMTISTWHPTEIPNDNE